MSTPVTGSAQAVGPYRLISKIGEGGMGVVYLAHAPDDRRVAIKVLRPYVVGDANGRTRLAREVTSLRRVRSPRIAEVYDADPWGETPYVVTRYVPGPSLREVVEARGPLDPPALLRLARGLAEALVVVHRADVLHRDVKPSNVLIEDGDPVLIDFGLAQLSDDMTLTQTGWLLGTPGYLAPEILLGDPPAPAADVHSWAASVVFAATGRGPYGSGPPMAIMDRARRGEFNLAGVPAPLVDILAAALRTDPANRPTASQLVDWLDAIAGTRRQASAPIERAAPVTAAPVTAAPVTAAPDDLLAASPAATPWHSTMAVPVADQGGFPMAPPATPEPESGRVRRTAWWLAVLCLVVASTVAAPFVAGAWVVFAGWGLRTLDLGSRSVATWRLSRGVRRRDPAMCLILAPWFAMRRLFATFVNACSIIVCAGGFVVLATFGPSEVETPSLVVAGLIAGLLTWGGPMTREVRRGGRIVTDGLPRSGLATAVGVILLLAVVSGLLATQQVTGTNYLPF